MSGQRHRIEELPILVLYPHNRCQCRCVMCDIWKIRRVRQITAADLEPHHSSFRKLRVRWIVFSGGEPLMHGDLPSLCRPLRREGIRLTVLTAGLSIEKHAAILAECVDDLIVSLDGPEEIHDRLRGIPGAFRSLQHGISALRALRPTINIQGRCTIQKGNHGQIRRTVAAAHELGLNAISFLAADLTSSAFNRENGWSVEQQEQIALERGEIAALDNEIDALIREHAPDMASRFVVENPEKLRRIAQHYRAHLGLTGPIAPRCNAPWVSAVVEADGTLRPCFFQPPIGNIHGGTLFDQINSPEAIAFRTQLDVNTDPVCRNCVCSLYHTAGAYG